MKDICVKCKKQMHRAGANTCYPCNYKNGYEKGIAETIKVGETAILAAKQHAISACEQKCASKCKQIEHDALCRGREEGIDDLEKELGKRISCYYTGEEDEEGVDAIIDTKVKSAIAAARKGEV